VLCCCFGEGLVVFGVFVVGGGWACYDEPDNRGWFLVCWGGG